MSDLVDEQRSHLELNVVLRPTSLTHARVDSLQLASQ